MKSKVFISYSWTTPDHEARVLELAQRLVDNGIDVALDKWDLREGHDKYAFMETMVTSPEITKVLMILDEKYAAKANERGGGVGTETLIISPNVYANTAQEKFIPIVTEVDEKGNAYIPTYLNGRIYIDLSREEYFEENYEKLLRSILNRPATLKPKIGKIPSYIIEDTPMNFKTSSILRSFDSQVDRYPNRINAIVRDFTNEFFNNLKDFRIESIPNTYIDSGKVIFENITQLIPLRDEYIAFITKLSKVGLEWDFDILANLFEKLPSLFYPDEQVSHWSNMQFDNFRFITNEIFIYTVALFVKYDQYTYLDHIFNTKYFIKDRYKSTVQPSTYSSFYLNSLNDYYEQLHGRKFIDVQADVLIKRLPNDFDKIDFVKGDLLCYYIGLINGSHWFPKTYIYKDEYNLSLDILNRLVSKRHFDKVKAILQVENSEELKTKLDKIKVDDRGDTRYSNSWSRISPLENLIKSELVASFR